MVRSGSLAEQAQGVGLEQVLSEAMGSKAPKWMKSKWIIGILMVVVTLFCALMCFVFAGGGNKQVNQQLMNQQPTYGAGYDQRGYGQQQQQYDPNYDPNYA